MALHYSVDVAREGFRVKNKEINIPERRRVHDFAYRSFDKFLTLTPTPTAREVSRNKYG